MYHSETSKIQSHLQNLVLASYTQLLNPELSQMRVKEHCWSIVFYPPLLLLSVSICV